MSVHRFLVTASVDDRMKAWLNTCAYANWIEGRENRHGSETWMVTVLGEHAEHFLEVARQVNATVEEIEGADDTERYLLRVGEPGSGWAESDD